MLFYVTSQRREDSRCRDTMYLAVARVKVTTTIIAALGMALGREKGSRCFDPKSVSGGDLRVVVRGSRPDWCRFSLRPRG
jgi:hypothetical protein